MEKLEMEWSLKNRGYLKSKKGGCVCVWVYVCYGCVCVEMKEWKKSIPENKRRKAWATKFMPHLSNRQCVIIKGFERKIL